VTKHLERGAALPDDHRGPHVDHLGYPLAQQLSDLVAGAQVLRGVRARRAEPAEVDDALHAGVAGGLAEVDGRLAVAPREVALRPHRVDQVVGGAAALQRLAQAAPADRVAAADVDAGGLARARGVAVQRAHRAAAPEELGDQEAADVAGCAGDERRVGFAVRGHRARYVPKQARDPIRAQAGSVEEACSRKETMVMLSKED
jgi:hypothetical protein